MQDTIQTIDPADAKRAKRAILGLNVGQLIRTHGSMFLLKLAEFDIFYRGSLRLATASGHILLTRNAPAELEGMSRWTLYQNDSWCLACRFDGSFEAGDPTRTSR